MTSSSQALQRQGVTMEEFPQTLPNLTAMAENMFSLIRNRNLQTYPSEEIRTAVSRTIATEGARGWKLDKAKQSHRIDICVALAMASLAAIRAQGEGAYDYTGAWISGSAEQEPDSRTRRAQQLYSALNSMVAMHNSPGPYFGRRWR